MRYTVRTFLVSMLIVSVAIALYHHTEYYKRWKRIETSIATFDGQQPSNKISLYFRSLFLLASDDLLPWMLSDRIDTIAIQSAWEMVELSVPQKHQQVGTYTPNKKAITKFLDLIEKRRKLKIPTWWRETVESAKANRRHNIYGGNLTIEPYQYLERVGMRCPVNANIEKVRDEYVYIANGMQFSFHMDSLEDHVCVLFDRSRAFAAFHEGFGFPHRVICFDLASNSIVWESEACGCFWGGTSGMSTSNLSMLIADESVYVFGAAGSFYVHAFDMNSGQTTFQFTNSF